MDKVSPESKLKPATPASRDASAPQVAAGSGQILAALKEARSRLEQAERARNEPIAIVGTACRLPGGADTPEEFWDLLQRGEDAITDIPADRWDNSRYYDRDPNAPGKMNVSGGGFIRVPREFEPEFFGIAPREALSLEPLQRLLLEVTWEALEDAGLPPARLFGREVGVFASVYWGDYGARLLARPTSEFDAYAGSGVATGMAAGRLGHILGLQGPALVVDTACSSSLVAVHLACQSLRNRECETALVGAASQILAPELYVNFTRARMLSPDNRCKTFDASANGFVRSEGCVVVVLKRLSDALAAGDNVLSVILGSAVNHDGHSSGLTVPNGPAQQAVIRRALRNAGVEPADVGVIEAHGTGTPLGDPIEVGALGAVFAKSHSIENPLIVGSVKSNVGHLEAAAGITGLLKVVLTLRHGQVPPNLHFKQPNPHIAWQDLPFVVPTRSTPWNPAGGRRIAGVSSFGFSGTNAHVVLAEAPTRAAVAPFVGRPQHLLALSARSETSLRALALRYAEFIRTHPDVDFADICYSANTGRTHFLNRCAVVAGSAGEALAALEGAAAGDPSIPIHRVDRAAKLRVAFLFAGEGAEFRNRGRPLYESVPRFRATLERCAGLFATHGSGSVADLLHAAGASDMTTVSDEVSGPQLVGALNRQAALFALEYALADLWMAWGVQPAMLMGDGVGEIVAACVAGVFSLEDAVKLIAARGRLTQPPAAAGSVAELRAVAEQVKFTSPRIEIISGVTGAVAGAEIASADYWCSRIGHTVRLADGVRMLAARGCNVYLEIGPSPVLAMARESILDDGGQWFASLRPEVDACGQMLSTAGALYTQGANLDWAAVSLSTGRPRVSLPHYAFDRKRYWIEAPSSAPEARAVSRPSDHPLLGVRLSIATDATVYEAALSGAAPPFLADHRIGGRVLMPATGFIEMALAAGRRRVIGDGPVALEDVVFHAPLVLREGGSQVAQLVLDATVGGARAFRVLVREGDGGGAHDERHDGDFVDRDDEWRLCASGVVRAWKTAPADSSSSLLEAIKTRATRSISAEEHYARMAERSLDFGAAFRGVRRVWLAAGEALGEIVLPSGIALRGFECHPVLLDACLQVVGSLVATGTDAWVPMSVGRISTFGGVPGRLFSHVRLDGGSRSTDSIRADIDVFDETGQRVVEVAGLSMRRLEARPLAAAGLARHFYEICWRRSERSAADSPVQPGRWLIFTSQSGHGEALAKRLRARGQHCIVARKSSIARTADGALREVDLPEADLREVDFRDEGRIRELLAELSTQTSAPLRGVVHFGSLDVRLTEASSAEELVAVQRDGCGTILPLAQALAGMSAPLGGRIWLVTEGAQSVADATASIRGLAQSPVLGLGRVIARELPDLGCIRVDLDPATDLDTNSDALAVELLSPDAEDEVALRGGDRYVSRLVRRRVSPNAPADRDSSRATRLVTSTPGVLDGLCLEQFERRALGLHEVEIRVHATGLGFRDVLGALDMYPGGPPPLGSECAGVVAAVGADVTSLRVGDPVFGLASGCFGSHARTHEACLALKPAALSFEAAAAIPSSFLTAHHTLEVLGKLCAGQTVLIHAGAGGVGQAALQIALAAGAVVFATAGSDVKRKWLKEHGAHYVLDSRSLEFAAEIRRLTAGRGVDYVLNSLAEPFLSASFEVLADDGCFLEIGKRGILESAEAARRKPRSRYFVVDLGEITQQDPAAVGAMLATLVERLRSGRITPPTVEIFPLSRAVDAFRHMAQARHIGKIVIVNEVAASGLEVVADATYLVTGGFGGLGLAVATHLAKQGARHLVLLGRGAPGEAALQRIAELQNLGVSVVARRCNIGQRSELEAVLADTQGSSPPVRGIIHAAGVLDDGVIQQQSWPRFESVFASKLAGTWNLHALTKELPLDWFVLFAAAAGVLGERGQGNYAAANVFLDSFAGWRRAAGLRAQSIDWGAWSQVGMAANAKVSRGLEGRGISALSPDDGVAALDLAAASNATQVIVLPVDWKRFRDHSPQDANLPLLREVALREERAAQHANKTKESNAHAIVAQFAAAPVNLRDKVMLRFVAEQIRKALGLSADQVIEAQQPLQELGLDSLMAVELRNGIAAATGCSLPATFAFDYPVPQAIAAHLASLLGARVKGSISADGSGIQIELRGAASLGDSPEPGTAAALPRSGASAAAATPLDIAALTEDEAAELLMKELNAGGTRN